MKLRIWGELSSPDPYVAFFHWMFIAGIIAVLLSCITGCGTLASKIASTSETLYRYKADMYIDVGGYRYEGMATVPMQDSIDMKITSKADLDVLILSTCHRFYKEEKLDKGWFRRSGDTFKYTYKPTAKEKTTGCPIYFQAFDAKGLIDWGYIVFATDQKLRSISECNGVVTSPTGHAVCQTKAGLEQTISFDRKIVGFSADASCQMKRLSDTSFSYRPLLGFCTAEFDDGKDFHALTALGFNEVFIRGK